MDEVGPGRVVPGFQVRPDRKVIGIYLLKRLADRRATEVRAELRDAYSWEDGFDVETTLYVMRAPEWAWNVMVEKWRWFHVVMYVDRSAQ